MTFRILVHPKAAKAIAGLPKAHQRKLANLVETLKENPVPFKRFDIKKLKGYENRFRVRLGGFRLIYEVDKEENLILLLKIEKREGAYR